MIEGQRIGFVDYAKAIGITLVVVGHANAYNSFCKEWIYAFHMPLFFLLSGMLLRPTADLKAFAIKKGRRIIVPYFVWGLIFSVFSLKNIALVCYGSHQTLVLANSLSSLWFFPTLFVGYVIGEMIINAATRNAKTSALLRFTWGVVGMLVGFLLPKLHYGYPWGLDIALVAMGFMMIGKCTFEMLMKVRLINNIWLLAVTCVLGISTMGVFLNSPQNGYVNVAESIYGNHILFLVSALLGSFFIICLSILLEKVNWGAVSKSILYVGQNSLTIMILHKPVISVTEKALERTMLPDGICLLSVALVTVIVCCGGCVVMNACVPQIIGKG